MITLKTVNTYHLRNFVLYVAASCMEYVLVEAAKFFTAPTLGRRSPWLSNWGSRYYRHRFSSYGRRAFSVAGPAIWNWLSDSLRDPAISRDSFKRSVHWRRFYFRLITPVHSALELFGRCALQIYLLTYCVRENVCNNSKNVKSRVFFWILKKKRNKRTYSFTGHLITQGFNTQLLKVSTGKSPTSNILLRNADTT